MVTAVLAIRCSGNIAAGPVNRWVQATVRSLVPQHRPGAELINLIGEPMVMAVLVNDAAWLVYGSQWSLASAQGRPVRIPDAQVPVASGT